MVAFSQLPYPVRLHIGGPVCGHVEISLSDIVWVLILCPPIMVSSVGHLGTLRLRGCED